MICHCTLRLSSLIAAAQWQRECKDAASAFFALQPDLATMRLDRQLAEGQPQAGAAHLTAAHLAKFFKNPLVVGWRDSHTAILRPEDQPLAAVERWVQRHILRQRMIRRNEMRAD